MSEQRVNAITNMDELKISYHFNISFPLSVSRPIVPQKIIISFHIAQDGFLYHFSSKPVQKALDSNQ
jgi:hypothetical protein